MTISVPIDSNLLNKLYDDLLHPSAQEIGGLLCNLTKTILITSYPFMQGAAFKDRLETRVRKAVEAVPEKNRTMPLPQTFLEYLDKTKFITDKNPILEIYDQILSASINEEKRNLVHPAFMMITAQLSNDEITIINELKIKKHDLKKKYKYNCKTNSFYDEETIENTFPVSSLHNQDMYLMYCTHLNKLDLANFPQTSTDIEKDDDGNQTASLQKYTLMLSEFGSLFAQVCCKSP